MLDFIVHTSFLQFSYFMLWYNITKTLLCNDQQCCLSQHQNKKHRSQTDAANLASDATYTCSDESRVKHRCGQRVATSCYLLAKTQLVPL